MKIFEPHASAVAFGRFFCSTSGSWDREKGNGNTDIVDAVKAGKYLRTDQNRGRSSMSIVGPHDDAFGNCLSVIL